MSNFARFSSFCNPGVCGVADVCFCCTEDDVKVLETTALVVAAVFVVEVGLMVLVVLGLEVATVKAVPTEVESEAAPTEVVLLAATPMIKLATKNR